MNKRIKKKNAAWLKEWHALIKESQLAYDKAKACGRYSDIKVQLFYDLEEKTRQHADHARRAEHQAKQAAAHARRLLLLTCIVATAYALSAIITSL